MSKTTDILRSVDPNLNIIPAGRRKRNNSKGEFDSCRGVICSQCGQEVFRILDGMCPKCKNKMDLKDIKKIELKSREKELRSIFKDRRSAARKR